MKITIAPKAIVSTTTGATMLMEANPEHSTTIVPRLLKWADVNSNEDWKFESITAPQPIHPESNKIERVIQFPNGSINLKFLRSNSFNQASSSRRFSTSSRPSTYERRSESEPSSKPSTYERRSKTEHSEPLHKSRE